MLQKRYRPDGWLGAILGAKLYFDFSGKYPFEKTFQGMAKELRGRGQVSTNSSPLGGTSKTLVTFLNLQWDGFVFKNIETCLCDAILYSYTITGCW